MIFIHLCDNILWGRPLCRSLSAETTPYSMDGHRDTMEEHLEGGFNGGFS